MGDLKSSFPQIAEFPYASVNLPVQRNGKLVSKTQIYEKIIEQVPSLIAVYNIKSGKYIFVNDSITKILGYPKSSFLNGGVNFVASLVHPDDFARIMEENNQAVKKINNLKNIKTGNDFIATFEFRMKHKDGTWRWLHTDGVIFDRDSDGKVEHVMNISIDITKRKEAEMLEIEKRRVTEEKSQFLEKATDILISSLDYETTIKNIANLIVPKLADYCRIVVMDYNGQFKEASLNHINPQKIALVKKLYQQYKNKKNITHGVEKILQTGQAEIIPKITTAILKPVKNHSQLLKLVNELQIKSYMGVPLKARGKVIGAITFSSIKDDYYYDQKDLQFAQELAYRVSITLDNARLYANEQEAVRLRDSFISIASHELKTPVASIKGFAQILQLQNRSSSKNSYYLSRLEDQIGRLTELINDLLDVSRIKKEKLRLNLEPIFVTELVRDISKDIQSMSMNHQVIIKGPNNIKVKADRFRLSQVFLNLLNNAIKYSPRGYKIIVTVKTSGRKVLISFKDFGIGIAEKNLNKIFEPFYQVDTKVRQSFGGLGLGLHISREIIKRHGGEIMVQSEKGVGSTFTISLPLYSS